DSLSQSFLVELLPYLMQLLFDSLKFLAINFSVACICSLCQLIDVITNRSQLLCYLNRPRFINLGGLHAIPQCPLFRKSWQIGRASGREREKSCVEGDHRTTRREITR